MKNDVFRKFYILSVIGIFAASSYPLYMGICVMIEMIQNTAVPVEHYPKYIIPYTPISLAVIVGILLLPLALKHAKQYALLFSSLVSLGVFFVSERLMETKILIQATEVVYLESWQMSLCYVPPEMYQTRTWEAVDVLLGGYSPAFKIHFYLISVVLILSLMNCFYGFGKMIQSGDKNKKNALILQTVSSILFLGLCIFACFTSFYRTGELQVPTISAVLMSIFFIVFGVTMGIYVGSFMLNKRKMSAITVPAIVSSCVTLMMYIGEMTLLNGNLYRFGKGFLFDGVSGIVLAPIDLIIILLSGGLCAFILSLIKD